MKRLLIVTAVLLALPLLAAPARAADAPAQVEQPTLASGATQFEAPADGTQCGEADGALAGFEALFVEEAASACGCRDLCKKDSQCVQIYGAGAVCLPTGSCGCKQCFAAS